MTSSGTTFKVVPDDASLRQHSLRQDSLKHVCHIVRLGSSARAPKTGARFTEARTYVDMYGQIDNIIYRKLLYL